MKKYALIALALLLLMTACSQEVPQPSDDSFFYYYPADTAHSEGQEAFCTVPAENADTLEALLERYLAAPVPEGGAAVLPEGWSLQSVTQEDGTALLTFRGQAASPLQRSLTCTCLTKTLLQRTDLQRVSFSLPGRGEPLVLSTNDILLTDTGMLPQKEAVTLYFPDAQRRYLVKETVLVEAMEAGDKPAFIMEQLLSGSSGGQLNSCIPQGTSLLGISVENGICTVNLSSHFVNGMEQQFAAERMAVYSIVNSLTELPQITSVDILVAGAPTETLYLMDLSSGITRDEEILASDGGGSDVTIYPVCGDNGLLAAIPVRVEPQAEQSLEEAAMTALLSYEGRNGMRSCLPAGTKLLSLRTLNGNCVVDLTGEFLGGCATAEEEEMAVRAVVATLCELPGITSVEIVVEGLEPAYRDAALAAVRQSFQSWLAD